MLDDPHFVSQSVAKTKKDSHKKQKQERPARVFVEMSRVAASKGREGRAERGEERRERREERGERGE